ncbi:hypothetical protein [Alkaliphilus oremlandii]|uniref:hypothetical protein n=1 Tax=Alkaliphilus oremlandii TaxID=461876 RepID=UPI0002DF4D14|nr:hypothetical protein [Alkaliphilus oremlandii]
MHPLMDNYLALYLSITKKYSPDKSLKAIGILGSSDSRRKKNINKSMKAGQERIFKNVEGGY